MKVCKNCKRVFENVLQKTSRCFPKAEFSADFVEKMPTNRHQFLAILQNNKGKRSFLLLLLFFARILYSFEIIMKFCFKKIGSLETLTLNTPRMAETSKNLL
jgi:hypothetical protein